MGTHTMLLLNGAGKLLFRCDHGINTKFIFFFAFHFCFSQKRMLRFIHKYAVSWPTAIFPCKIIFIVFFKEKLNEYKNERKKGEQIIVSNRVTRYGFSDVTFYMFTNFLIADDALRAKKSCNFGPELAWNMKTWYSTLGANEWTSKTEWKRVKTDKRKRPDQMRDERLHVTGSRQ